jgi:hypothetical protein
VAHDTLRGVAVGSAIESNLIESTHGSKLDTPSTDLEIIGNLGIITFGIRFGQIINKRSIEVESGRQDLLVVPQDMAREGSHVRNSFGSGETVHGDFGLGSTELESG